MNRQNAKIALALSIAFFVVILLRNIFIGNTPVVNTFYVVSLPGRTASLVASLMPDIRLVEPTATLVSRKDVEFTEVSPVPTTVSNVSVTDAPNSTPIPTISSAKTPTTNPRTRTTPTPTRRATAAPTRTPTRTPTSPPLTNCPATSSNVYTSMNVANPGGLTGDLTKHPEVNLYLRGFGENNESKDLQGRHGNDYGLDHTKPPQISTLYGGEVPTIIKTYDIYEWDFQNNRSLKPQRASPNFAVHMIGLNAGKGRQLRGLEAGREIGGGNVFAVLYVTKNDILFTHSASNNLEDGYLFYFVDICVDPNLIAEYEKDSAAGKRQLPVIAPGQVFGTASDKDVKIAIRDSWSFVDPRAREDWWFYGQ